MSASFFIPPEGQQCPDCLAFTKSVIGIDVFDRDGRLTQRFFAFLCQECFHEFMIEDNYRGAAGQEPVYQVK